MAKRKQSINPYQKVLGEMEKKLNKSFQKMSKNMLKKTPLKTMQKDMHELMLLLGETNYLAKECTRIKKKTK